MKDDNDNVPLPKGNKSQDVLKNMGSNKPISRESDNNVHSNKHNRSSSSTMSMTGSTNNKITNNKSTSGNLLKSQKSQNKDIVVPIESYDNFSSLSSSSHNTSNKTIQNNQTNDNTSKNTSSKVSSLLGNFMNTQQRINNQPSLSQESMVSTESGGK